MKVSEWVQIYHFLGLICIGEEPEYKPFHDDLRSVPKAGRPREQVENHGRAYTQAGKWAENTKEKSRQCFMVTKRPYSKRWKYQHGC